MADFFERISHPALTDLAIDWGGLEVSEVYPRQLPDLFVGRPVLLSGRLTAERNATVRITGRVGDERLQIELPIDFSDRSTHKALPSVWARMKIGDLADGLTRAANPELPGQMKQVALDYGLLSAFTAFVAVDSTRITEGAEGTTVPVAVPVPDGVKYETTVSEK